MSVPFRAAAVIPAHDALPDVLEAVASACAQTLAPAEIVVVDDASGDGTAAAVERRFGEGGAVPVRVLRGRFGSAAAARNAGWRAARAPWIAFLDADDLWFPGKLAVAAATLAAAPAAAWFFSDGEFRALDGQLRESWLETYADLAEDYVGAPVAELFEVNFVLTSSAVVRRDALEALGGFDEGLSHAEDLDLWIRLARRWPAAGSRRALVRYQHRAGGLSRQIERRLLGDVELFDRLVADPTLPAPLRARARRRRAMAHYKLAVRALREGDPAAARAQLPHAWLFPGRALPVLAAWGVSLLPAGVLGGLRRQPWATRGVGRRMLAQRRVALRGAARRAP
ncbi:MAG: glycosyltransferase family 2 protein [Candidatus Eisenbacteria bacterium]|nr:glycosyltransferase family 2 protein [Candidatus Eisenbacteria bacterium]